jgi:hypothetical protein
MDQFLFANQSSGVLYQVLEGFIDLRTKLDLLSRFEDTSSRDIQREFAESIVLRTGLQRVSIVAEARTGPAS